MKKIKYLLVALMLFSQLSSPTLVYADVVDDVVDDIMPQATAVYDFSITPTVEDTKVSINLKDIATDTLVEDTKRYIVKSKLSFNEILDNQVANTYPEEKITLVTGLQLKDYTQEFTNICGQSDICSGLNGKYQYEFNLYEVAEEDVLADDADEATLNTFITSKEIAYTSSLTDFYQNQIDTTLEVTASGTNLACDTTNTECTLAADATDKLVEIDYNIVIGDTTIDYDDIAYVKYTINDELILYDYYFGSELDFASMLYGTYDIEVSLMDENDNQILTDTIKIVYAEGSENTDLENYFDLTDTSSYEELLSKIISATTLDETTRNELEIDMDLLQDYLTKKPIDEDISTGLTNILDQEITLESFTTTDDGETYFGSVTSEDFIGRLKEGDPLLTVDEILDAFIGSPYTVSIVNKNGQTVTSGYIETGMELVVNYYSNELRYTFVVKADIDGGLVTESEVNSMIDALLEIEDLEPLYIHVSDINEDEYLNILDISSLAGSIAIGNWITAEVYGDTITPSITLDTTNTIRVGDTFKVSLNLKGFDKDYINAIEGMIDYDKSAVSLVGISVGEALSEYGNFNYDTSRFIQAGLDIVDTDSVVMTFTFKALKETTTLIDLVGIVAAKDGSYVDVEAGNYLNVKIEKVLSTNNDIVQLKPSTGTLDKPFNKDVYEYTLYVDSNTTTITLQGLLGDKYASTMGFREYKLTGDTTVIYVDVKSESGAIKTYKINVVKVYPKSSNNYLEKLEIAGYEIEFNKDVFEYEITVESDVTSLDITAIAELASANVRIYGNDNFQEGENIVTIVVTAEDGSERTYTIKVNKKAETKKDDVKDDTEEEEESEEETDNNTEKTIIIILIILVVIGLLYLIFKKDDEDEENKKSNTQKK